MEARLGLGAGTCEIASERSLTTRLKEKLRSVSRAPADRLDFDFIAWPRRHVHLYSHDQIAVALFTLVPQGQLFASFGFWDFSNRRIGSRSDLI